MDSLVCQQELDARYGWEEKTFGCSPKNSRQVDDSGDERPSRRVD